MLIKSEWEKKCNSIRETSEHQRVLLNLNSPSPLLQSYMTDFLSKHN